MQITLFLLDLELKVLQQHSRDLLTTAPAR